MLNNGVTLKDFKNSRLKLFQSSEESIISYDSTSKIFTSSDYPRSQFSYSESDLAILSNSDKLVCAFLHRFCSLYI